MDQHLAQLEREARGSIQLDHQGEEEEQERVTPRLEQGQAAGESDGDDQQSRRRRRPSSPPAATTGDGLVDSSSSGGTATVAGSLPSAPRPPPATTSPSPSSSEDRAATAVHAVLLVSFDHALGPIIEFSHPQQPWGEDEELKLNLPFLALPDGSHAVRFFFWPFTLLTFARAHADTIGRWDEKQREEDYSYFHLYQPSLSPTTIFGISCNRQIQADALLSKDKSVTRSTVQKAVVVLASKVRFLSSLPLPLRRKADRACNNVDIAHLRSLEG